MLPLPTGLRADLGLNQRNKDDRPSTSWTVLKDNPGFLKYFCGSVISDLGTWLQNTAQVLLAYHIAHSVLAVGLVTIAQFTSPLVIGPFAGVMADKFGGRRTLLGTQIVALLVASALGYLEFANRLTEMCLIGGAVLSGLCFTFALPARNVLVRRLVPEDKVRSAYVMDNVSYNLGRAIAPMMGLAIAYWFGFAWAFVGNAFSFVIFTIILWEAGRNGMAEPERRSRMRDGFRIARGDGEIMILLLMVAAVTIADDPILVLGPALATKLHEAANTSGWFIAALGLGSVLGSLRKSKHLPSLRLAATSLALLGCCMIVFVTAPSFYVSVAAAAGAGICCLIANSATRTLLSKAAGPVRVASVMAAWAVAWAGSKPLASLIDGSAAGMAGIRVTGVLLALPAFVPIAVLLMLPARAEQMAERFRRDRLSQVSVEGHGVLASEGMTTIAAIETMSEAVATGEAVAAAGCAARLPELTQLHLANASVMAQRHGPLAVAANNFPSFCSPKELDR